MEFMVGWFADGNDHHCIFQRDGDNIVVNGEVTGSSVFVDCDAVVFPLDFGEEGVCSVA